MFIIYKLCYIIYIYIYVILYTHFMIGYMVWIYIYITNLINFFFFIFSLHNIYYCVVKKKKDTKSLIHRRADLFMMGIYKGYYRFLWFGKCIAYRSTIFHLG